MYLILRSRTKSLTLLDTPGCSGIWIKLRALHTFLQRWVVLLAESGALSQRQWEAMNCWTCGKQLHTLPNAFCGEFLRTARPGFY